MAVNGCESKRMHFYNRNRLRWAGAQGRDFIGSLRRWAVTDRGAAEHCSRFRSNRLASPSFGRLEAVERVWRDWRSVKASADVSRCGQQRLALTALYISTARHAVHRSRGGMWVCVHRCVRASRVVVHSIAHTCLRKPYVSVTVRAHCISGAALPLRGCSCLM